MYIYIELYIIVKLYTWMKNIQQLLTQSDDDAQNPSFPPKVLDQNKNGSSDSQNVQLEPKEQKNHSSAMYIT